MWRTTIVIIFVGKISVGGMHSHCSMEDHFATSIGNCGIFINAQCTAKGESSCPRNGSTPGEGTTGGRWHGIRQCNRQRMLQDQTQLLHSKVNGIESDSVLPYHMLLGIEQGNYS